MHRHGPGDQLSPPLQRWRRLIGFYVFVYTIWLKRRTPQNIVIGGAAGAFPPIIGWAAVTGASVDADAAADVRHRVLLDAAAFLGAGAVGERRLRARRVCRCCRWCRAPAPPAVQILSPIRSCCAAVTLVPWRMGISPAWCMACDALLCWGSAFVVQACIA